MKNIDVLWFVEHISRELDVVCAATHYLKKDNHHTVEIIPFQHKDLALLSRLYNPKILVIPYCYSVYDSGISEIITKFREPIYFNLYWEQILYRANISYKAPHDLFAQKYVLHHAWSKKNADYFKRKYRIPGGHIFINGQPAYKLYEEPYSHLYPSKEALAKRYKLDPKRLWLFFPENFSWAFYSLNQLKQIIKFGQDEKAALEMRDYCQKVFSQVMKWFKEASYCPVEIILRPRPAIAKENFIKAVKETIGTLPSNLFITDELSVREWIMRADLVISSFSTSLIEASIAHKPIYMVVPEKIPEPLWTDWYKYIPKLMTRDDFLNVCCGRKIDYSGIKLGEWAKKEFMANGDPIINLASYMDGLLKKRRRPVLKLNSKIIRESYFSLPKQLLFYLFIRNLSGKLREIFSPHKQFVLDKYFESEVKRRMGIYKRILE